MILAVDAGNTRIKWALRDGESWAAAGILAAGDAAALSDAWINLPRPMKAVVSNVAGDKVRTRLEQALTPLCDEIRWASAESVQCGVKNGYRTPTQLGSDRWAALVAARGLTLDPCVVICAGTALTVDALDAGGYFLGGVIVPGIRLMQQALVQNTAALGPAEGAFSLFPDNTADAIRSGALLAMAGTVERMRTQLEAHTKQAARCIVSGGDASVLMPLLSPPAQHVENLVLEGLIRIARS